MVSESQNIERKVSNGRKINVVSGNYVEDELIPDLKHRYLNRVDVTKPSMILITGGSQLESTSETVSHGFVADEYRNPQ